MTTVHAQIQQTLMQINDKQTRKVVEKSRQFQIGEWVLVDRRNLSIKTGNNRSLTNKWIGPYKIIKVVSRHAYKLEYPKGIRMHDVVHTSLLKPFRSRAENEMDEDTDDEQKDLFFDVEKIVDSKRFGNTIKYRVRWKGYDETDDTWEPFENVENVIHLVKDFHQLKPRAPRDPAVQS